MGTEPATQAYALTGNQTSDLSVCRMIPNQLSHTDQGYILKRHGGLQRAFVYMGLYLLIFIVLEMKIKKLKNIYFLTYLKPQ